jgi:uncharacterized membrane protein YphA (DoxX/SURF4 family)
MQIKTAAGTALVPTLSRVVLAVTFIISGWFFCFQKIDFSSEDMTRLQNVQQTAEGSVQTPEKVVPEGEALAVNRLILHFHHWDLQTWAQPLGWSIAIFQLFAGGLVLVGLFTRIAALGLTVLIAGAFYQISLSQNGMFEMNPFTWRLESSTWYVLISQLSLFVLALGLIFTGSGPLSVDRVLWNRKQGGSAPPTKKSSDND